MGSHPQTHSYIHTHMHTYIHTYIQVLQILDAVSNKARAAGRGLTPTDTFEFFIDQCRKNMHVVLCMSPIGSGLRDRLRQFPSLVNCCTIDWFFPWPAEGLTAVAGQVGVCMYVCMHVCILVNCCTIDLFFPWPAEGLTAVAGQVCMYICVHACILAKCCTIDLFFSWPAEGLTAFAGQVCMYICVHACILAKCCTIDLFFSWPANISAVTIHIQFLSDMGLESPW